MTTLMANCAACRFNGGPYEHPDSPDRTGLRCAFNAPVVTGGMMAPVMTIWPLVQHADWCGEFQSVDGAGWRMPTQPEREDEECPF
jgi:hypothetical protein